MPTAVQMQVRFCRFDVLFSLLLVFSPPSECRGSTDANKVPFLPSVSRRARRSGGGSRGRPSGGWGSRPSPPAPAPWITPAKPVWGGSKPTTPTFPATPTFPSTPTSPTWTGGNQPTYPRPSPNIIFIPGVGYRPHYYRPTYPRPSSHTNRSLPTYRPSQSPTFGPTTSSSPSISNFPSLMPSVSMMPSEEPTDFPSESPSVSMEPSDEPSEAPTDAPTVKPEESMSTAAAIGVGVAAFVCLWICVCIIVGAVMMRGGGGGKVSVEEVPEKPVATSVAPPLGLATEAEIYPSPASAIYKPPASKPDEEAEVAVGPLAPAAEPTIYKPPAAGVYVPKVT